MTDREHLERLLRAMAGPEEELAAAIEAAAVHIAAEPIPGLEVNDSTLGEWVESGGTPL